MTRLPPCLAAALWLAAHALSAQSTDLKLELEKERALEDFRWGVRAFHETHWSDAVLSFEKSLSRRPQDPRTRVWLGNALYKNGFEEEALNEWRQALELDPGNATLRNRIQLTSFRRGVAGELARGSRYVVAAELKAGKGKDAPLRRPTTVHPRPDGSAYVVAFGSNRIVLLDANNGVREVLSGGLKGYLRPFDCLEVTDPRSGERALYISEYGADRLLKADLRGERLKEFGGLRGPQYLAADPSGYLYVTEWGSSRVSKFDLDGNLILSFRQPPAAPTGIAARAGEVFVADQKRRLVLRYDSSGNLLEELGRGELQGPEGLAFWGEDTLLVADGNRILALRLGSQTWETLADLSAEAQRLTHLAPSPNGDLYAVDFDQSRLLVLSEMGSLYTGLSVQVERIEAGSFPEVFVDVSVRDRYGRPVVGLEGGNFLLTEGFKPVNSPQLARANTDPAPLELALVVEKSLAMKDSEAELAEAVERLFAQVPGAKRGQLFVVGAGEKPAVDSPFGATRLSTVQAATQAPWSRQWRFDRSLRLAAGVLAPRYARRAVVFLGRGTLSPDAAFAELSLDQLARCLANNGIAFYAVHFEPELAGELAYLCQQTGGRSFYYFSPRGIEPLVPDAAGRVDALYTLKYRSRSNPDFGRQYLDIQLEATLHRRSGRADGGYFAPLSD